ncbi:hypothetical protein PT7_2457 [Pusillimonas sp. T7-7]|uniref:MFS transporter n=1 Tax=Pusillimonas sp. (strain T7-7) TaxID=1007105 RepID=UPI000208479E|nr:MFS transporter [Pusillimonas sp. T7-7]AEC20997.1 hypothetical protein PT7_2457 [Pusillimonas sp. T7-7]
MKLIPSHMPVVESARVHSFASIETPYSWWLALVTLVITSLSFGAVTSIPVLLKPLAHDWNVGVGTIASVHLTAMFGAGLGSLLLGRLLDRHGFFCIAVVGALSTTAGLVLAANATHLITLHLAYGILIGGVGQGAFFSPITAALAQWFDRNQALAIAIATSGQGIGGLCLPTLLRWATEGWGWRLTLTGYGIGAGLIMLLCALAFRKAPSSSPSISHEANGVRTTPAQKRRCVWVLGMGIGLSNLAAFMVIGHLTAYGEEQGFAPVSAAMLVSVMLGATLVSRFSFGYAANRWGRYPTLLLMSALHLFGIVWLVVAQSYFFLIIGIILIGLGFGGYLPAYGVLMRQLFPASEAGRRISEIYFFAFITAGIGSGMGGWLRDLTSNYVVTFSGAATSASLAFLILWYQRAAFVSELPPIAE